MFKFYREVAKRLGISESALYFRYYYYYALGNPKYALRPNLGRYRTVPFKTVPTFASPTMTLSRPFKVDRR